MPYSNDAFNRTLRGAILRGLQARLVTDNIVNRDLVRGQFEEPEDTVEVITMGEVQVNTYNGSFGAIQDIDGEPTPISADLKQSFRFKAATDDTASQMAAAFTQDGVGKLLRGAQQYILGMYTQAGLQVTYDPSSDQIKDAITQVAIEMDEANAPDFGRWIVLPPAEYHAIKDLLETRDTALGDDVVRGPGFGGVYKGISVYKTASNQFTEAGTSPAYKHTMAGYGGSIAYADAILNIRRNPALDFSGDQVDGLHVGGGKVVRPGQTLDFRIQTSA